MNTDHMPYFARLLAQYGIDPSRIPISARSTLVISDTHPGVIMETIIPGYFNHDTNTHATRMKFYPEPKRPETTDDKDDRACEWADYRKAYGVSTEHMTAAHEAFCAGWDAARGHSHEEGPTR